MENTNLEFAFQIVLYKLTDARRRQVERWWTILDQFFFQLNQTKCWGLVRLEAEELQDTQVVVVGDVNVDEQHLLSHSPHFSHQLIATTVKYFVDRTSFSNGEKMTNFQILFHEICTF